MAKRLLREMLAVAAGAMFLIALSATAGLAGDQQHASTAEEEWAPAFSTFLAPLLPYLDEPYGWGWER